MNKTGLMIDIMKMELEKFSNIKKKFIEEFSEMDYLYIEKVQLKVAKLVVDFFYFNLYMVSQKNFLSDYYEYSSLSEIL